jgi:predicted RNA-binding protein YlxR (DUF448 family)
MRNPHNDIVVGSPPAKAGAQSASGKKDTRLLPAQEHGSHISERTCILSRLTASRDNLIRLALGPDGEVAPDVRARAPGRGAWIGVSRAELDEANAKGKLKGALQRAFKRNDLNVPADLGERIEKALRQATLDRLGMEARSGNLVNGSDRVETAARSGKVHCSFMRRTPARTAAGSSIRPGASAAIRRILRTPTAKVFNFPRNAPSCPWRLAAKMWYISP